MLEGTFDGVSRRRSALRRAGLLSAGLQPLLWCYCGGIVVAGCLPALPTLELTGILAAMLLPAAAVAPARRSLLPLCLALLLGFSWALWQNTVALSERLPLARHGADIHLPLQVTSLPERRPSRARYGESTEAVDIRFSARILEPRGTPQPPGWTGQKLYLTWYRAPQAAAADLRAGSRWLLPVRLKRPRGSVNPHGFDYEGWLLRRGVFATGYVRPGDGEVQLLGQGMGLPALRHWLRDRLSASSPPRPELLNALLLGDRSGLSRADKALLRDTGTAHLLAISGLHVGMVAGFCLLLGGLLGRAVGALAGVALPSLATLLALAGTATYTLLAGAPLSAQRALVMTWVLLLAWRWRRRVSAAFAFALAMAAVLTLQPLAFYGAGFWLSFVAVAALLLGFSQRLRLGRRDPAGGEGPDSSATGGWRLLPWFAGLLRSQWIICLALLLPSLFFFSGFSIGGFLLNLVAIPWMGLGILPTLMAGALLNGTAVGQWCLQLAGWQLQQLMHLLEVARGLLAAWQPMGAPPGIGGLVLAGACLGVLLLPAGLPGRRLCWLVLLPLSLPFWPQGWAGPPPGDESLRVTVLDVGQGLAVAVRSPGYQFVYDTGPLSASGWSAGSQIVAPYLLGEGVRRLDSVVVSHGDSDHAGGLQGLLESLQVAELAAPGTLSRRLAPAAGIDTAACVAGRSRRWGELELQWLWPDGTALDGGENDHSCVALLRWRGRRILLTGDISSAVEQSLVERFADIGPVDLLVAPHHGSRSSSSPAFIRWARPQRVVFSAGFRHHFGHPDPQVVARYVHSGARVFNTATSGALEFTWRADGRPPAISRAREAPRFWYADHNDETDAGRRLSRRGQLW